MAYRSPPVKEEEENAIKNEGAYAPYDETGKEHENARMVWLAFVGGTRETQQMLGDVVLTEQDIVEKKDFKDGCVFTTWSVDLHYPKEEYIGKYEEDNYAKQVQEGGIVEANAALNVPIADDDIPF